MTLWLGCVREARDREQVVDRLIGRILTGGLIKEWVVRTCSLRLDVVDTTTTLDNVLVHGVSLAV